jgi:hypothetical protein
MSQPTTLDDRIEGHEMWDMIGKDPDGTPIYRNNWGAYSQWIPVSERLPEEEEEVLACWVPRKDGMACAVLRNLNGKVCWTPADQWTECDPPKWWQPLPEPPA